MSASGLISLKEAAEYLGISTKTLERLVAKRAIRYFQAGFHCRIKFRQEWLDEWIEAIAIEPRSPDKPKLKRPAPKPNNRKLKSSASHGLSYSLLDR